MKSLIPRKSPVSTLRLDLQGEKQVQQALRQTAKELSDLKQANKDTSQMVLSVARARAPKRSGRLSASGRGSPDTTGAGVTFTVPYANPIHWGWRARNIKPQPFALSAAETTQPVWLGLYERNIEAIARKEGLHG